MSINRVAITGNLTRDAELRTSGSGVAVCSLSVAVHGRTKKDGEWVDNTSFIDCKLFGRRAESVSGYLTKGQKVAVEGKLSQSSWEDKEGKRRTRVEVLVDDIDFIAQRGGAPASAQAPSAGLYEEEIPF